MEAYVHQALTTHRREIHREKQLYFQRAAIEAHAFARVKRCRKNHEKSRAKANALDKNERNLQADLTHSIHVWYIYLHLVDFLW